MQYDDWAETTSDRHKKVVQGILQRLFDEGQIYKDKQSGYYSVRQEQFLTDKERGADGQFGPEWGEIEFREEENYYFKLSQHKDWLLRYLDNRADAVIPDFRQKELRNAVEKISAAVGSTSASPVPNHGSTGESNYRSTKISSLTSGSTP